MNEVGQKKVEESFTKWIEERKELIELIQLCNVNQHNFEELKKIMKPEPNTPHCEDQNTASAIKHRKGLILSPNSILKLDRYSLSNEKANLLTPSTPSSQNPPSLLPNPPSPSSHLPHIQTPNKDLLKKEPLSPLSTSSTLYLIEEEDPSPSLLSFPPRFRYFERYQIAGFGQVLLFYFIFILFLLFYFILFYFSIYF